MPEKIMNSRCLCAVSFLMPPVKVLSIVYLAAVSYIGIVAASPSILAEDVIPPLALQSPRLRFHLGETANNQPLISTVLPAMPYPASPWFVAQWHQNSYIAPVLLVRSDNTADAWRKDAVFGEPAYAFAAPDGHASVRIFHRNEDWIYELAEDGGILTRGGGSNLFLSVDAIDSQARFDRTITYDTDVKLSRASIKYDTPTAESDGSVMSQTFTGFGLMYDDPTTNEHQFVFMQLPIASSRQPYFSGLMCSQSGGRLQLLYVPEVGQNDGSVVPFSTDAGQLHHQHYNLTQYVAMLLAKPFSCDGRLTEWTSEQRDLRNWRLTGMYIGIETETEDHRDTAKRNSSQGSVRTALQVANVRIQRMNQD